MNYYKRGIIKELDSESFNNLNKDYTEEEKKSIVEAANLLSKFDDLMIFTGKQMPDRKTATTAIIYAKDTFKGQVGERLLKELPLDWKDYLTGGSKDKGE